MLHIQCYTAAEYGSAYAVHILTDTRSSFSELHSRCRELLAQHFSAGEVEGIGIEEVPGVVAGGEHHTAVEVDSWTMRVLSVRSTVPDGLRQQLASHRLSYITVDVDVDVSGYGATRAVDVYHELVGRFGSVSVARSMYGYHFRAVHRSRSVDEMLGLRRLYGDDGARVARDAAYAAAGLSHLTNFLFSERFWRKRARDAELIISMRSLYSDLLLSSAPEPDSSAGPLMKLESLFRKLPEWMHYRERPVADPTREVLASHRFTVFDAQGVPQSWRGAMDFRGRPLTIIITSDSSESTVRRVTVIGHYTTSELDDVVRAVRSFIRAELDAAEAARRRIGALIELVADG